MSAITIMEFRTLPDGGGNLYYPPAFTTRLSSPATFTTNTLTLAIVITCDSNTRMTWDGTSPGSGDYPLLSVIPNQFNLLNENFNPNGPSATLRFQ